MDGPRDQDAERRKKRREQHEPQRNAVHPHVVVNIGSGDPLPVDLILKPVLPAMKVNRQV